MKPETPNLREDPSRTRRKPAAVLLVLSGIGALSILRSELLPNLLPRDTPTLERQCLPLAMMALLAALHAVRRREAWPSSQQLWPPIVTGLGLFAAYPVLLSTGFAADGWTRTILFALIPIFCLIFEAAMANAPQSRLALPAGLAGVSGALCVFPVQLPASITSAVGFGATVLTAALIAAALCLATHTAPSGNPNWFAAISTTSATLVLAATSLFSGQPLWTWRTTLPELLWAAAIELPSLAILFWLMRRTGATRIATRYLFTPLLAILAGAALLQQPLTLRISLGLCLMAAGGASLLSHRYLDEDDTQPTTLSLR